MNFYTYYSYEPFGRGYIGSRQCVCNPEEDTYYGSYRDKTFRPTEKIILNQYETKEEALKDEVSLHMFYQVDTNPHFANKSQQRTAGFSYCGDRAGEKNTTYGKIRITNGTDESVCYPDEIPEGWWRGRSDRTKKLSDHSSSGKTRGAYYSTFLRDSQEDVTILSLPIRELARRYHTSHTSIQRWKRSL